MLGAAWRDYGWLMILVTGAGGAVGTALLQELKAGRHRARGGYRSAARAAESGAGDDAVVFDLDRPESLAPALEGVEAVFLLGAMGPAQTRQELAAVAAATEAGVGHVVKLSVWRADERLTPIAELHRPVEEALESSGLAWTFLRPNYYMQNFTRQMAAGIASAGVIAQPASRSPTSFVDARDVARVAAAVLTDRGHDGEVHELTGPEALSFEQVAQTFSVILGRPVRFAELADEDARARMLDRGMSDFHADALIEVSRTYRDGGAEILTSSVLELTGRPPTSLSQFIGEHREAFTAAS